MTELKLDIYYDLTCEQCGRTRSKGFGKGIAHNKAELLKNAAEEDWRVIKYQNFCPICTRVHDGSIWKSVKDVIPPTDNSKPGIQSMTEQKFMVLTKEGAVVDGYIYNSMYSCSGYAVYLGGDDCLNNVTHWVPERFE